MRPLGRLRLHLRPNKGTDLWIDPLRVESIEVAEPWALRVVMHSGAVHYVSSAEADAPKLLEALSALTRASDRGI